MVALFLSLCDASLWASSIKLFTSELRFTVELSISGSNYDAHNASQEL
jgi:hypothetical protein